MTPDGIQVAVERVWQEMHEQTEAEIFAINNEAKHLIVVAENRAKIAEEQHVLLKEEHVELQQSQQRLAAEKELLLLDLKKLHEEEVLLQERYKALDERFSDMQGLTSHHLKDLADAHKNAIEHLDDKVKMQEENYSKLINEIKQQSESTRQQYLLTIDNLKVISQKQNKSIEELQAQLQENLLSLAKGESLLKALTNERDEALNRLNAQEKLWSCFNDKLLVSAEVLKKIDDMPRLDLYFEEISSCFTEALDKKFFEIKDAIKDIKFEKLAEAQDE